MDTRLRLAVRAYALEFVEALDQIVASLAEGLSFEQALTCLDDLPPMVEEHALMGEIRNAAVHVLAKGIRDRDGWIGKEQELQAGMEALAKCLGTISRMLEEKAAALIDDTLRDVVMQLPTSVFKLLLASESLQLFSENETYALLRAWLYQSPHVAGRTHRAALFKELAPLLRYHHMTADFVASWVSQCPLMRKSGLLSYVVLSAFVHRKACARVLKEGEVTGGPANRGEKDPSNICWKVKASFTLEEVAALQPGGSANK